MSDSRRREIAQWHIWRNIDRRFIATKGCRRAGELQELRR
jgi:hypothetical protein